MLESITLSAKKRALRRWHVKRKSTVQKSARFLDVSE